MSNRRTGYTIIELMITLGLIGILATLAIPSFLRLQLRAKTAEGRTNIAAIREAEETYYSEFNFYVGALPPMPVAIGAQKTSWGLPVTDPHGFNTLGFTPEGAMYFQYAVTTDSTSYTIAARSDVDGDGTFNTWGSRA